MYDLNISSQKNLYDLNIAKKDCGLLGPGEAGHPVRWPLTSRWQLWHSFEPTKFNQALSPSLFLTALVTEKLCRFVNPFWILMLIHPTTICICTSTFGQPRFRMQAAIVYPLYTLLTSYQVCCYWLTHALLYIIFSCSMPILTLYS